MKEKYWIILIIIGIMFTVDGFTMHNLIFVIIGFILLVYGFKLRILKNKLNNGGNLKWHLTKKQNEM